MRFPKPTKAQRIAVKAAARDDRKERLRTLARLVWERANGRCENVYCMNPGGELDHWLGGTGRRRTNETYETVWLLCCKCHDDRHANRPSASHWNAVFAFHARKWGYNPNPHIVRDEAAP